MKVKQNWIRIMSLALSLPSAILSVGWGSMKVVELGFLTRGQAFLIFIGVILGMFYLMVYYASRK